MHTHYKRIIYYFIEAGSTTLRCFLQWQLHNGDDGGTGSLPRSFAILHNLIAQSNISDIQEKVTKCHFYENMTIFYLAF